MLQLTNPPVIAKTSQQTHVASFHIRYVVVITTIQDKMNVVFQSKRDRKHLYIL